MVEVEAASNRAQPSVPFLAGSQHVRGVRYEKLLVDSSPAAIEG